jgi:predicted DNA-binding protein
MPTKQSHKKTGRKNKALIAVYVSKELHAGLKKLADQDGRTLSNYLNRILSPVTNT